MAELPNPLNVGTTTVAATETPRDRNDDGK